MNELAWLLLGLAIFLGGGIALYTAARIVFAAYFRSKQDHDMRSQHGRTQKYPR